MNREIRSTLKKNSSRLKSSHKTFADIYDVMFSQRDNILCEYTERFRVKKESYGEIADKIETAASGLFARVGATHKYIALAMDNSPCWIVAFWAILKSGNKPYLVNMRYPVSLTNNILKTLDVKYTICLEKGGLETEYVLLSELQGEEKVSPLEFENEIAFSSSATSMNEVVCFYTGLEVSEQILNFEDIIKKEPRMVKQYNGKLKHLAFLPFYHVFGLFAVYFWFTFFGRTLVFLKDYSSNTITKTCKRHKVTHIFAVPMLWHTVESNIVSAARAQGEEKYNKLLKALKFTTKLQNVLGGFGTELTKIIMGEVLDKVFGRSVMFCINGGSYLKDSALKLLNGIGYSTYNGYGMSEIAITSVELGRKPKYRNLNSIGMPFSSVEYQIGDDGILKVRGSSLCKRKLINGAEQKINGWFSTGDNMECRNGRYFILGRTGDMVIGENGENINPDTVEKFFTISGAKAVSVLGLKAENSEELSIVLQISEFIDEDKLSAIRNAVYEINDTLPKAQAVKRFYFTTDPLCPPTAIKVSRTALIRKIESGEVKLTTFSETRAKIVEGEESPLFSKVRDIVAEELGLGSERIEYTSHIFYDLSATSIQYFSVLTRISEEFSTFDFQNSDKYCYTIKEICEYLEKCV